MPSMPSLSVCHGLQSCLDPLQTNHPNDTKPQIHRWLRLAWVSTEPQSSKESRANPPPPPATYAQSTNNNLDMCTETLGCETGAMCSAYELEIDYVRKKNNPPTRSASPPEFPPPLTTLRGEGRLRLGRKREEGRLLLIPFKPFLLESERSGGRLLLRILPAKGMEDGWSGRCKEGEGGGAAIFNCDSFWVASS